MEQYWPLMQKRAYELYEELRHKYPVDLDQLESDALDFVLEGVRKLTDGDALLAKLSGSLPRQGYFRKRTIREEGRRYGRRVKGGHHPDPNAKLNRLPSRHEADGWESIESMLGSGDIPLTGMDLTILQAVLYKRDRVEEGGWDRVETVREAIGRAFPTKTEWACNRWHTSILPRLRDWAKEGV